MDARTMKAQLAVLHDAVMGGDDDAKDKAAAIKAQAKAGVRWAQVAFNTLCLMHWEGNPQLKAVTKLYDRLYAKDAKAHTMLKVIKAKAASGDPTASETLRMLRVVHRQSTQGSLYGAPRYGAYPMPKVNSAGVDFGAQHGSFGPYFGGPIEDAQADYQNQVQLNAATRARFNAGQATQADMDYSNAVVANSAKALAQAQVNNAATPAAKAQANYQLQKLLAADTAARFAKGQATQADVTFSNQVVQNAAVAASKAMRATQGAAPRGPLPYAAQMSAQKNVANQAAANAAIIANNAGVAAANKAAVAQGIMTAAQLAKLPANVKQTISAIAQKVAADNLNPTWQTVGNALNNAAWSVPADVSPDALKNHLNRIGPDAAKEAIKSALANGAPSQVLDQVKSMVNGEISNAIGQVQDQIAQASQQVAQTVKVAEAAALKAAQDVLNQGKQALSDLAGQGQKALQDAANQGKQALNQGLQQGAKAVSDAFNF